MTEDLPNILVVDDTPVNCELLEEILDEDFHVQSLHSGAECLQAIQDATPDLILLDVSMPDMDGYETCQRIKTSPDTALIPIVFVSAMISPEDRLRGYEAGAEDYITKPFQIEDILATVQKIMARKQVILDIEKRSQEAMKTAFQAMSNSAELGSVLRFFQEIYQCQSIGETSEKLIETTESFGLSCCVMTRSMSEVVFTGCEQNSIEAKVLQKISLSENILDFGARSVINRPTAALLVRNMPVSQPETYGRLKDNLMVMLDGVHARISALDMTRKLQQEKEQSLHDLLNNSHMRLQQIHGLVEKQKNDTINVIQSINTKIENVIFSFSLEDNQEYAILSAIDKGVEELSKLTEYNEKMERSFLGFIDDLENLVKK